VHALDVTWLGRVPYLEALALQQQAVEARRRNETGDRLLLLEHPPVVTLGSSSRDEHVLLPARELAARGIELHPARRGGDVTFHAPGQLVGYLIVNLAERGSRDAHALLRAIEDALIDALGAAAVVGRRVPGMTGVFVDDRTGAGEAAPRRKIASIGIGLRHWVSYHGFALNVGIDLSGFDVVVPCGLRGVEMTSVARERSVPSGGLPLLDRQLRAHVSDAFRRVLAHRPA
jgi:lipoate-protein ligase B